MPIIEIYRLKEMKENDKKRILMRSREDIKSILPKVKKIIDDVRKRGDEALIEYTKKFDGIRLTPDQLRISKDDIKKAYEKTDKNTINAIKKQIKWSTEFHKKQLPKPMWSTELEEGVIAGQVIRSIESVGLYVPGGTAPYPTVMQILAVPAKVAGVKKIIACTPPRKNNYELLIAADLAGVDEIYRVGGVQAIAAMTYGTETIPKVLKITGPGNVYVTAAKLLVYGNVDIDMPAGPSEAIILADDTADPRYVAADILARAEHDGNAVGLLVTPSFRLAKKVQNEVQKQKRKLSKREIIDESLSRYSGIIVTDSTEEAIEFTNEWAPEHLEIQVVEEILFDVFSRIKNAGSIFLGKYNPVAAGDYAIGINHVLPTCGYAKMFSPLGVDTYLKRSEWSLVSKKGLRNLWPIIDRISTVEGFDGHRNSAYIRLKK